MDEGAKKWRERGTHLPRFMRDFHDQKDLFKAVHDLTDTDGNYIADKVDWMTGHVYVVDVFLWFMARHGYTLQKTKAAHEFDDIERNVAACRMARNVRTGTAIGLVAEEEA